MLLVGFVIRGNTLDHKVGVVIANSIATYSPYFCIVYSSSILLRCAVFIPEWRVLRLVYSPSSILYFDKNVITN